MKTHIAWSIIVMFVLLAINAMAQSPRSISYQGCLSDANGHPKPDAVYTLIFRLYDAPSGGNLLWSEQKYLATKRGLFSTQLGDRALFGAAVRFDSQCWLGIQVGAEAELTPRIPLSSVGNSFCAVNADTAEFASSIKDCIVTTAKIADGSVNGSKIPAGQVVKSVNTLKDNVTLAAGSNVTITPSGNTLTISATGGGTGGDNLGNHTASQNINLNGHWLSGEGGDRGVFVNSTGNVGIGTSNPSVGLHQLGGATTTLFMQTNPWSSTSNYAEIRLGDEFHFVRGQWGAGMTFYDHDKFMFLNGNVGVGTTSPAAKLHVVDGNLLISGTTGITPVSGAGTRLMYVLGKSAFRAGKVDEAEWDDANIGMFSTAFGNNTIAGADMSFASGYYSSARGDASTAMGRLTSASNNASTAMGDMTTASGGSSTAMGSNTLANGSESTAMGFHTTASGERSTAMGTATTASGERSTAMGTSTIANGQGSTAMGGYVSTNGHRGSFIIGDDVTPSSSIQYDNEFEGVFSGGYWLYTGRGVTTGVYMGGGTSGWTNVSDKNKKENFRSLDGEALLSAIRALSITEWNYKHTDPSVKYIGPVAQDFYAAFHLGGKDSLGINSISIDGVNMAAVQALEMRTSQLREATRELQAKTAELESVKSQLCELTARLARVECALSAPEVLSRRVIESNGGPR